ncbi:hypothetical protein AVEN_13801-1 [Araneus ventricosus]|uniref:EGF-like domain-containing protein n=1 Tax=Araneus ventricosus TaxID=182803 RepID=A0A4Y2HWP1_ARAVE|nr:hypothetical protein AVEN_13801-1 [Araneus ventricosus]
MQSRSAVRWGQRHRNNKSSCEQSSFMQSQFGGIWAFLQQQRATTPAVVLLVSSGVWPIATACICKNGNCVNEGGKDICKCNPGYGNYKGNSCIACGCGPDTNCIWSHGRKPDKICFCKPGYSQQSGRCLACNCGPDSNCTFSGFLQQKKCICKPGYSGVQGKCVGIDPTNLSCDQKYLLDICTAISFGVGSSDLVKCQPGTLNLARWLKTANRILRLHISTSNLSNELTTLFVLILRVYAPSWFRIKVHHFIKDGARHMRHFISSSRYLPKKYRDII